MSDHYRLAGGTTATLGAWVAWFLAHIAAVNELVQFAVLCVGLLTGIVTLRFAWKRR